MWNKTEDVCVRYDFRWSILWVWISWTTISHSHLSFSFAKNIFFMRNDNACMYVFVTYIYAFIKLMMILLGRNHGGNVNPQATMISVSSQLSTKIQYQNMEIHDCVCVWCVHNIFFLIANAYEFESGSR